MMKEARSSFWDNLKGILIFLVVLGHYLAAGAVYSGKSGGLWGIPQAVVAVIYMVHMPLFLFVSGYFSQNTDRAEATAVRQLLVPYLLCNLLCIVLDWALLDGTFRNPVFYPVSHMWYLGVLFLCRISAKYWIRLRWSWLWALGLSLLSSVLQPGKDFLLLGKLLTFLPFFLLGLQTNPETVEQLRRIPKWLCGGVLLAVFGASLAAIAVFGVDPEKLCFLTDTCPPGPGMLRGLGILLLRYLLAAVLGICLLALTPEKGGRLTVIGRNTMPVYLVHNLPGLRNGLYLLDPLKALPLGCMLWWVMWSLGATMLLGSRRAGAAYQRLMSLSWLRKQQK